MDDRRRIAVRLLSAIVAFDPDAAVRRRRQLVRLAYQWADDVLLFEAQESASEPWRGVCAAGQARRTERDRCVGAWRNHAWDDDGAVCVRPGCAAVNSRRSQCQVRRARQRRQSAHVA